MALARFLCLFGSLSLMYTMEKWWVVIRIGECYWLRLMHRLIMSARGCSVLRDVSRDVPSEVVCSGADMDYSCFGHRFINCYTGWVMYDID